MVPDDISTRLGLVDWWWAVPYRHAMPYSMWQPILLLVPCDHHVICNIMAAATNSNNKKRHGAYYLVCSENQYQK